MSIKSKIKRRGNEIEEMRELSLSYLKETRYDTYFCKWSALEHEPYTVGKKFYLFSTLFLAATVIYALVSNSPIMAITFILIGIVGYIFLNKEPQTIDFSINHKGIIAGNEMYEFDNLKSFWIFYNPPYEKKLSLYSKNNFTPRIHIPLGNENPVKVRETLIDFIPEVKQEHSIVDVAENFLHR